MMNHADPSDELQDLIAALRDDHIDAAGTARLNELLKSDPDARSYYVEQMMLTATLNRQMAGSASGPITTPVQIKRRSVASRFGDAIDARRHSLRFSTLTAVLTALAWVGFSYFLWSSTSPDGSRPNHGDNFQYVAEITGQYKPRWAEGMPRISRHHALLSGERLNLAEGLIEITFDDGAVVVLEGPSEFVVDSRGAGTLDRGRLTALVPEEAVGFVVDTPSIRIVDLGTEFGVEVRENGDAEVVVLRGKVDLVSRSRGQGPVRRVRLIANQGAFIVADSGRITKQENVDTRVIALYRERLDTIPSFLLPIPSVGLTYKGGGDLDQGGNWVGGVRPSTGVTGTINVSETMINNSAYDSSGAIFNQTGGDLDFDDKSFNLHTNVTYNLLAGSMTDVGTWNINGADVIFNITDGIVTATTNNLFHGSKLNFLAGAGTATVGELSGTATTNGTIDFSTGWTGSYTVDNYAATSNWETLFTTGISGVSATFNGQSINSDTFAKRFLVSGDGRTLRLAPSADAHDNLIEEVRAPLSDSGIHWQPSATLVRRSWSDCGQGIVRDFDGISLLESILRGTVLTLRPVAAVILAGMITPLGS